MSSLVGSTVRCSRRPRWARPAVRVAAARLVAGWSVAVPLVACGSGAAGGAASGGGGHGVATPPGAQEATVVRVVDGDTLVLAGHGEGPLPEAETRVRLLEVDAPESVTPERPVECSGPEAADALRALAPPGSALHVMADREPVDRFGRALLYAWTSDGVFVNEALVREGYAEAVLVGRNDRYIDLLRAAEQAARDAGSGMWGACPAP